jgi:inositol phosphorylceramide mannosyltransferase catalytic subunit
MKKIFYLALLLNFLGLIVFIFQMIELFKKPSPEESIRSLFQENGLKYDESLNKESQKLLLNNLFNKNKPQKIPRIIHQIWIGDEMPSNYQKNIKKIRDKNPEYIYKLYDGKAIEEYILQNYGEPMLKIYNQINSKYGAARADFARYLIIYNEGGVYLDIKSNTRKPLREIIKPDDQFLLSVWETKDWEEEVQTGNGEFQQWHVIARPRHPYLESVITECIKGIENFKNLSSENKSGRIGVLRLTGPIMYTNAISKVIDNSMHTLKLDNYGGNLIYENVKKNTKNHYSKQTEDICYPEKQENKLLTNWELLTNEGISVVKQFSEKTICEMVRVASAAYYNKQPFVADNVFDILKEYGQRIYPNNPCFDGVGAPTDKAKENPFSCLEKPKLHMGNRY